MFKCNWGKTETVSDDHVSYVGHGDIQSCKPLVNKKCTSHNCMLPASYRRPRVQTPTQHNTCHLTILIAEHQLTENVRLIPRQLPESFIARPAGTGNAHKPLQVQQQRPPDNRQHAEASSPRRGLAELIGRRARQ